MNSPTPVSPDEQFDVTVGDGVFEDISVSIIGNNNTLLITDRFPQPAYAKEPDVDSVWMTISEARAFRDWLNKVLP